MTVLFMGHHRIPKQNALMQPVKESLVDCCTLKRVLRVAA